MSYTPNNINGQATMANSAPVAIASNQSALAITDNSSSITVDAPVATPVNVRLSDGAANITTLPVSLATVPSHAVTNAGTFAVQATLQANSGVDIGKLTANQSVNTAQINGVTPLMGNGVTGTGSQRVTIASDNTPFSVNASTVASTSGGASIFHLVSAATTNATVIKASAGQVYGWYIYNSNAAARKVAFHNIATTPTAGTGVVMSLVIPPSSGANVSLDMGVVFATGIAITTVTDLTDAGTTAVALNDLIINIFYK